MPTTWTHGSPSRVFPTRRAFVLFTGAVMAFAVYASLLPFEFRELSLAPAWSLFRGIMTHPPGGVSRTNFIANVLLFVPIGFGLMGAFLIDRSWRSSTLAAIFPAFAVSVLLSLGVEFLQLWVPGRVSSRHDVAAQSLGCIIGVACWIAVGPRLTRWLRAAVQRGQGDRFAAVLVAYAAVWIFVNLAPFDITLDPSQLARRWRSGAISLMPFGHPDLSMQRVAWDAMVAALSAVPLGLLGLVGGAGNATRRGTAAAIVVGGLFVVLVEAAQIVIRSHAADMTDVLFGVAGVAAGVWVGYRVTGTERVRRESTVPRWSLLAIAACAALVCAYHWLPYDFTVDGAAVRGKLARLSLIPFAGYHIGSDLNALNTLLTKLGVAAPLGLAAAFALPPRRHQAAIVFAGWMVIAAMFFAVIELGQLFLPTRVPDPTDVLVGIAGSSIGLWAGQWLQTGK